jgi:DNA-binding MarR family transcriptional regulator
MASSKKFNELAHQSFLSLHSTYGLLMKLEERTFFNDATISFPQFLILMTVEASTPPVSQTTIAKNIHRGLNSVSMIIDRMEKQGLVIRTRSEEDRRESHITVTPQGKTALAKAIKIGGSLRERLGSAFKPEELKEAIRLLDKAKKEIERELGYSPLDEEEEMASRKQLVNLYRKGMEASEG